MNEREKERLIEYLYPTTKIRDFLVCVIYQDLKNLIPKELCISQKNKNYNKREENYNKVIQIIKKYFYQHNQYLTFLENEYPLDIDEDLFDDVIINFLFCLTQEEKKYKNVDIFKDKKSICFSEISILDFFA